MLRLQCQPLRLLGKIITTVITVIVNDVSQVANEHDEVTYCLPHGLEYLKENKSKV